MHVDPKLFMSALQTRPLPSTAILHKSDRELTLLHAVAWTVGGLSEKFMADVLNKRVMNDDLRCRAHMGRCCTRTDRGIVWTAVIYELFDGGADLTRSYYLESMEPYTLSNALALFVCKFAIPRLNTNVKSAPIARIGLYTEILARDSETSRG